MSTLIDHVRDWDDVSLVPHPEDAVAIRLGRTTIGVLHREGRLEVPMPQPIRSVLLEEGIADSDVGRPEPDWVGTTIDRGADVDAAGLLLRLSYLYRRVLRSQNEVAFRHIRVELAQYDLPETLSVIYETMLTKRTDPSVSPQ